MKRGSFLLSVIFLTASLQTPTTAQEPAKERVVQNIAIELKGALQIPGSPEKLDDQLHPYMGSPINKENLSCIKEVISQYFVSHDNPMIFVQIPEQEISSGVITFVVAPATIEQITFSGNNWFSNDTIESALNVEVGEDVNEPALLNRAAWINRNPFVHTDLIFSRGETPGSTQMNVISSDRLPFRVFAGIDNTGNSFSDNERFFTGFNASVGLRNLLSYQFASAPHFPEFLSHYANWTSFLPWQHELIVYAGYATMHPDIASFRSKGLNLQGSFRYLIPIKPLYTPFQQQIIWGADFKRTNSRLFFEGALSDGSTTLVPVSHKQANLFQFYLGYQLDRATSKSHLTFKPEIFFSPFTWLPDQNDATYDDLRESAKPLYLYGRLSLGDIHQLPKKFSLSWLLRLQMTTAPLLPSEQFGLGGYDTVRGYAEREFLADDAVLANLETEMPPLSFSSKKWDKLIFLAFIDYGWGLNRHKASPEPRTDWLLGIGPGLRYLVLPYLTIRADYGFKLHLTNLVSGDPNLGRFHFGIAAGY